MHFHTSSGGRALFLTPLSASLTVETAVVLPIFLLCMLLLLQLGNVYYAAIRYSSALSETSQEMGIAAYAARYGDPDGLTAYGIGTAYGSARTQSRAGSISAVNSVNFLLSSILQEDDRIDLVMTYRMKSPFSGLSAPGTWFYQHASVRGWTGRAGSEGSSPPAEEGHEHKETVYVTEHGVVYHKDPHCTHIHLSIQQVNQAEVPGMRNEYGEKYHACELCGGGTGTVYITSDGNRYHSSLECSGLKRSVREISVDEAGDLRPCSRCGG